MHTYDLPEYSNENIDNKSGCCIVTFVIHNVISDVEVRGLKYNFSYKNCKSFIYNYHFMTHELIFIYFSLMTMLTRNSLQKGGMAV